MAADALLEENRLPEAERCSGPCPREKTWVLPPSGCYFSSLSSIMHPDTEPDSSGKVGGAQQSF